jgi:thiamine pyrophosphokinase
MRFVIFVNGLIRDYETINPWLRTGDVVIGCDGGTEHCLAIGRRPDLIVGDLDSLNPGIVEKLSSEGTVIERHPAGKDQTDLELAIERAVREGADEILLLGAMGGRLDQTLANLLILAQRDWPVPIFLAEDDQVACVLRGEDELMLRGAIGSTVSLIPLCAEVIGITYQGLKYPLSDATLRFGSTRGISNVLMETPAMIQIAAGVAVVVQTVSSKELDSWSS